jgi:hypothetical protein
MYEVNIWLGDEHRYWDGGADNPEGAIEAARRAWEAEKGFLPPEDAIIRWNPLGLTGYIALAILRPGPEAEAILANVAAKMGYSGPLKSRSPDGLIWLPPTTHRSRDLKLIEDAIIDAGDEGMLIVRPR